MNNLSDYWRNEQGMMILEVWQEYEYHSYLLIEGLRIELLTPGLLLKQNKATP